MVDLSNRSQGLSSFFRNPGIEVEQPQNQRFPFNQQKIQNISKRGQMVRNLLGEFQENPEIVEFPESEPLNRKLRKFGEDH